MIDPFVLVQLAILVGIGAHLRGVVAKAAQGVPTNQPVTTVLFAAALWMAFRVARALWRENAIWLGWPRAVAVAPLTRPGEKVVIPPVALGGRAAKLWLTVDYPIWGYGRWPVLVEAQAELPGEEARTCVSLVVYPSAAWWWRGRGSGGAPATDLDLEDEPGPIVLKMTFAWGEEGPRWVTLWVVRATSLRGGVATMARRAWHDGGMSMGIQTGFPEANAGTRRCAT